MCDPVTLGLMAIGGLSSIMMAAAPMPTPPEAAQPAVPAPESPTPEADVKLGADGKDTDDDRIVPTRQRLSGNTMGNLGRSSLTI